MKPIQTLLLACSLLFAACAHAEKITVAAAADLKFAMDEIVTTFKHPGLALVRVRVGASILLSRLTKRAMASMDVVTGKLLWVQVKSVALLE